MTDLRGKCTEKLKANLRCVFSEHTRDVEELETRKIQKEESPEVAECRMLTRRSWMKY
jgi:hypothetical protein